ncbi:MAG: hypothetical protein ABII01_05930 [Candidatus Woesearchaeota archaeon]
MKKLQKEGIDVSNYFFIDCVTSGAKQIKDSDQFIYMQSPGALTQIGIAISTVLDTGSINLMILDSISSMLIHSKEVVMVKFLHNIISKVRTTKTKALYTILQKDMKGTMEELELFADGIIEI